MKARNPDLSPNRFGSAIFLSMGLFLLSPMLEAAPSNLFFDLDLSIAADNNVGQAKLKSDIIDDTTTTSSLLVGYQYDVNYLSALSLSTGIKAKQFKQMDTQNSVSLLLNGGFLWQTGLGYRKPVYQFVVNTEIHNNETRQQDSTFIKSQLFMTSRITDVITGTIGLGHNFRDSESTVYDLSDSRIFLSMDYALSKKSSWYGTLNFISGETFSIARPDTDEEILIALSVGADNIQADDAFNAVYPSQVTDWQAYRIHADSIVFALGFNYGFGHGNSIDLSYTFADVSGDRGAEYQREIVSASLLKRF